MRTLVLMRGAPGSGKSTFIKKNNLEHYTLCTDDIRIMCGCKQYAPDGKYTISQSLNKQAWRILYTMLEERMKLGAFTVIDATHSTEKEMRGYKELIDKYRYKVFVVDMTDVSIEELKDRNVERESYKQVPEEVIDKFSKRFESEKVPRGYTVIKPEELWEAVGWKAISVNEYKKIHHLGDIHGCNTVLQEYLEDGLKDDELYIFVGDYTDRGIENVEVLQFLQNIYKKPNVVLIEGNHEIHMRRYLNGEQSYSKTFNEKTRPVLDKAIEESLLNKKVLRDMYRTMRQCFFYEYHYKKVICTHGGITDYKHFELINTDQMISGVGKYEDYEQVAATFCNGHTRFTNFYQINGHRNVNNVLVQANERCFNLEGGIEWGGCLRVATLDENGFETHEIKNNVWDKPIVLTEDNIVEALRQNKHIKEKMYGNISSFNFTEEAFRKGIWDEQTCKARGLFINTETNKIAVRGYEKFFDGTREDTNSIEELADKLVYPVHAYVKYNGFLGMLSYDKEKDDLIFCTKSVMYQDNQSNAGTYVKIFKGIFERKCNNINGVKQYLKEHDATMLFEVIDPENDPHIIEYKEEDVVLLDIVANSLEFKKLTYEQMMQVMIKYGFWFHFKSLEAVILDKEEFINWYKAVENKTDIEGYVLEDDTGYMTKLKLPYYIKWKWARSVANSVLQFGKYGKYATLTDELKNFHDWLVITSNRYILSEEDKQIIKLRKAFYEGWEPVWNSR